MLYIPLVLAALALLLGLVSRLPLSPEASRKTIHVGIGLICLSFPWVFSKAWQVDLLAALAVLTLLLVRWLRLPAGQALHRVRRLSFGELLFPVGVTLVFRLADGELGIYLPAIAVLTFADTAGALVGQRFGKHPYHTNAGRKSMEGSLAVFLVSFAIVLAAGVSDDLPTAILISLVAALVAAMAEGILGAGIDNLVLPLAVAGLILFLRDLLWIDLLLRLALFACLTLALTLTVMLRLTSLNGGGLLSATIFGYLCFALGGPEYLVGPVLLFLIHLGTTYRHPGLATMNHSADSIFAIALPALIWVVLKENSSYPPETCLRGFTLTLMAQAAFLHSVTQEVLDLPSSLWVGLIKISLIAFVPFRWWFTPLAIILLVASIPLTRSLKRPEQAVLAYLFSLFALLP